MRDEETRTTYRRMADAYDELATSEERTAGSPILQKAAE
jgi:hypothetical protein